MCLFDLKFHLFHKFEGNVVMSGTSAVAVSPGYSHSSGTNVSTPTTTNVLGTTSVPASPATPIQHRLMLKTQALDTWSLREQLGLASAVLRSGDQNWVSVSRQMKPFAEEGRPNDWFSQKNCALQYKLLLEKVLGYCLSDFTKILYSKHPP